MKSIKQSLSLWLSIIILVVGLSSATLYYLSTVSKVKKDHEQYIMEEADSLANDIAVQLWTFNFHAIEYICNQHLKKPYVAAIYLSDENDKEVYQISKKDYPNAITIPKMISYKGRIVGNLRIDFAPPGQSETVLQIFTTIGVVLAVVVIAAILAIQILLRNYLSRPMRRMRDGVLELVSGNYNQTIRFKSKEEIQQIIHAVNSLSEILVERDVKIRENTEALENKNRELNREIRERIQVEENLKDQHLFLQLMIDAVPISVFYKNINGIYLGCNETYAEFLGMAKNEIIGKSVHDIFPIDLADIYYDMDSKLLQNPGVQRYEAKMNHADGRRHNVLFNKATYQDHNGQVIGLIGAMLDITDQKKAEEDKKRLEDQLRQSQKIESIGTLAGGIAHDFNNILSPIVGYAEILKDDLPDQEEMQYNIDEILTAARRAKDLVRQILTFSRQTELEIKPVKIQNILDEVIKLARSTLPATIEINSHVDPDCHSVMADPSQIHQIAMNIITNAFHAMQESGGSLTVELKNTILDMDAVKDIPIGAGSYVQLTIADTGKGIDRQIIDRIFEPYFTTKELEKGTGLGLAVVHGIIKNYKGHITVQSQKNKGTAFDIFLPTLQSFTIISEDSKNMESQTGTERVLLVDDEDMVVQVQKQILTRQGYHVNAITSSVAALENFKESPNAYDIVITDLTMPNLTGDVLAGELMKVRADIPVIICTGFSEKFSQEKADHIGVRGFLMKPVLSSELTNLVRKVLDEG